MLSFVFLIVFCTALLCRLNQLIYYFYLELYLTNNECSFNDTFLFLFFEFQLFSSSGYRKISQKWNIIPLFLHPPSTSADSLQCNIQLSCQKRWTHVLLSWFSETLATFLSAPHIFKLFFMFYSQANSSSIDSPLVWFLFSGCFNKVRQSKRLEDSN